MEGQLLYILDYNLRFDEREACVHFAPFMAARIINPRPLTPIPKEFRAAAVERLYRLSRSRVRTQLPAPLSEVPLSPPTRQIAKHLPSSRLAGTQTHSYAASPVSSVYSCDSLSATDSVESLTEDTGSSSDSASSISSDDDEANGKQGNPSTQFILGGIPPQAHRGGRKVSEAGSVRSIATARADDVSSPRNSPLPLGTCTIRVVNRAIVPTQRASSHVYGVSCGSRNQSDADPAAGRGVPVLRTKANINRSSNGFLSRMWSTAINTEEERPACDLFSKISFRPRVVSIVGPAELHPLGHVASAFQRPVLSNSAILLATADQNLPNA
jgi:G1/S-specific cyclin PLC1